MLTFKQKLSLCWRILRANPGEMMAHADRELPSHVTDDADDEMQKLMNQGIQELILVFGTQGHCGSSAGYATSVLSDLLQFKPLRPLTGEADEWFIHDSDGLYAQNKRCGHVFKDREGRAYDIDGRVFREPNGACYTGRVYITFPYTPTTEYVDVDIDGRPIMHVVGV